MKNLLTTLSIGAIAVSTASAQTIIGDGSQYFPISSDLTLTAGTTYAFDGQVYVLAGATLTIEPGVEIRSIEGGSLAIARGGMIHAEGTAGAPITFTSDDDNGTWRQSANEWGNLTIMGDAYISENATPGNVATPNASNFADMEGLTPPAAFLSARQYGGGNDDDNSGTIAFCSFRYGGRVVGLDNELNGLSIGGVGRATDMHHVEVMNNIDDGIEIWGGTLNIKYFSVWNIGDDSIDLDQGWRGKAQFGLVCQGWSFVDPLAGPDQGSGVGDNAFEIDGAEAADYQPVTTATVYNVTVIGNPLNGDDLTNWKDNANVQFRNSIFMFAGANVCSPNVARYGANGTFDWPTRWTTPAGTVDPVNAPGAGIPADFYSAQTTGNLIEFTNSYFYGNAAATAYDELNARVTMLDPRPTGVAAGPVGSTAPADGFFTPADYMGGFNPDETGNWLQGWSASEEFGFVPSGSIGVNGCEGGISAFNGTSAQIRAYGSDVAADNDVTLEVSGVFPGQFGIFLASNGFNPAPFVLPNSTGFLCLNPGQLGRYQQPTQIRVASSNGVFSLPIDVTFIPQGAFQANAMP
ncbi:MAG: hypothetical protein AAFY58_03705, partial [Planctomycetota bacterium]